MFQLLIVDDERLAIEAIQQAIDWESMGITNVFEANNIKKAKEIMQEHNIDLMLCDIEMPQGSGLELLEWVREHKPKTVTIFLTCHADFSYAQKAIQLGSLDYLLKPTPYETLAVSINKAIRTIEEQSESMVNNKIREVWNHHQPLLIENFWRDVIEQTIPSNLKAIQDAMDRRGISMPEQVIFLPILIKIKRWNENFNKREAKILEYALRNAGEELLINKHGNSGHLVTLNEGTLIAIQAVNQAPKHDVLRENCRAYIEACNSYFYCDINCYIGEVVAADKISDAVEKLIEFDKNNATEINSAISIKNAKPATVVVELPDMTTWAVLIKENAQQQALDEIKEYVMKLSQRKGFDTRVLHKFQQDFTQMIYYVLKLKGVKAHLLYSEPQSAALITKAIYTVDDLLVWIHDIVEKTINYISTFEQSESIVDKVIQYIKINLEQDLSRESIAETIGMNPDYLTRVFKKATGLSIVEYLAKERVKRAQELLTKTDMPISMVAASVGYHNFSHFSQMFKKHTSVNPNVYRNEYRSRKGMLS